MSNVTHALALSAQVLKVVGNVFPVIAMVVVYLATQLAARMKVRAATAHRSHSFAHLSALHVT